MIEKIAMSLIFICLIIAVFLSINGITEINISNNFYSFMQSVAIKSDSYNWRIPAIPHIVEVSGIPQNASAGLLGFIDFMVNFLNAIIDLLNLITSIINVVIQVIQFIWFVITDFQAFKESLLST